MAICWGAQFNVAVIQIHLKNEARSSSLQVDAARWVLAGSICLQNLTLQQAHAWSYDDYTVQEKDMIHLTFNLNSDLDWLIADKVLNRLASILLSSYWLCPHWPVKITVKHNAETQRAM